MGVPSGPLLGAQLATEMEPGVGSPGRVFAGCPAGHRNMASGWESRPVFAGRPAGYKDSQRRDGSPGRASSGRPAGYSYVLVVRPRLGVRAAGSTGRPAGYRNGAGRWESRPGLYWVRSWLQK
jgi:hypothetical protein